MLRGKQEDSVNMLDSQEEQPDFDLLHGVTDEQACE